MGSILSIICLFQLLGFTNSFSQVPSIFQQYDQYKETSIKDRRFKHSDLQPLIKKLEQDPQFKVQALGQSIQGRSISMISIGNGPTSVLLWSQMHGDEPTATMAIFDLFNFFQVSDEFDDFKSDLKEKLTLHFIPMLNPDGAQLYQRRNALDVDLNRDAMRLQNPEAQLLKEMRDKVKADWGFNLHDQSRYYAVGQTDHTASLSFLAPAYNYEKTVNESRSNAMRLIGQMNSALQQHIPGNVGRYSDAFEPRAFGDNIQKWGTNTILIETGGLKGDREKQALRKYNFLAFLTAFEAIAEKSYADFPLESYEAIPFNNSNAFHDLILRNVTYRLNQQDYQIDVAFRNLEVDLEGHRSFYFKSSIRDIGDLSTSYGYQEFEGEGYTIEFGKVWPKTIKSKKQFSKLDVLELLKEGVTTYFFKDLPLAQSIDQLPVQILGASILLDQVIAIGKNPALLLKKEGTLKCVIINGFLYNLEKDQALINQQLGQLINQ